MSRHFFRQAALEAPTAESKGIRLSFASEHPVLRKDKRGRYWEVLSHAPGDANLGFLNRQGIVLQDHDEKLEIGDVVRNSAKVDADKKTRAEINILDGKWLNRANKEPNNIPVSVGYVQLSIVRELPADAEGIVTRIMAWRPYEISLLTLDPADPSVGINRSMKKRKCPDCEGTGRCRCRATDDDDADEDCEDCDGDGDCDGCDGDGYFHSARVDSRKNLETKEKNMTPEEIEAARQKSIADTQSGERTRAKEISLAADEFITKHGRKNAGKCAEEIRKFANEAIEKGEAAKDFNLRAMTYITNAAEPEPVLANDFLSKREASGFSLMRCIQSAVRSKMKGGQGFPDEKEFEGEVIKEYRSRLEKAEGGIGSYTPEGFIVPPDIQFGSHMLSRAEAKAIFRKVENKMGRDMQATVFAAGGATVPTYWLLPVIELLYNKAVLPRLGCRTLSGLTGNVVIPRLEAPSTPYSVAEIAALTASQQTLGQVAMIPHRVGNYVVYSKQLIFQASPDIENLIREDMMTMLALKHDLLGLAGQGGNAEPLGIFNTPGIGAVTFGATPTYIKMVLFETLIRAQNVMDALAYTSTSLTKGSLKTVAEALTGATTIGGAANAIWKSIGQNGEEDGLVNGWKAIDSQQVPLNLVLCGAFNQFIHGMWGGFDVVVDYYTAAPNAEVKVIMNTWLDYAARHPQAFCASTDAGNQ